MHIAYVRQCLGHAKHFVNIRISLTVLVSAYTATFQAGQYGVRWTKTLCCEAEVCGRQGKVL